MILLPEKLIGSKMVVLRAVFLCTLSLPHPRSPPSFHPASYSPQTFISINCWNVPLTFEDFSNTTINLISTPLQRVPCAMNAYDLLKRFAIAKTLTDVTSGEEGDVGILNHTNLKI